MNESALSMIEQKAIHHPRFQRVDVNGVVHRLTVEEVRGFIVEDSLQIQLLGTELTARLNKLQCQVGKGTVSLSTFSTFAEGLCTCHEPTYWDDVDVRSFYFILIRFAVHMMDDRALRQAVADQDESELRRLLKRHADLTEILVRLMQAEHLNDSPYVANNRAYALLRLGLDPKEQYDSKAINRIGRNQLKQVHPDLVPGADWIFRQLNDAMSYLK